MDEAQRQTVRAQIIELGRRPEAGHGEVVRRRAQILADGDDADAAQVAQRGVHLVG